MSPTHALRLLGRQARWALPAGVFAGVAVPPLATALRPLLTAAVIGTLTAALLRLDWGRLAEAMRRPALPAAIGAWQLVASPVLAWAAAALAGFAPETRLLLVLQAAAPPIGSAAVFAMIVGLDGILAVIGTVVTTLLLPQAGVQVDLAAFFVRVALLVAAPFALAWALRRGLGAVRLARPDALLGGVNVALLLVFAIAVMDGVTARLSSEPAYIAKLLWLACLATAALHLAGYAVFRRAGITTAYSAALMSGNRNMGLMLVVTAGTAGDAFSLYVGIAQIPMYFAPLLLEPFLRRSLRQGPGHRGS